jgi:hypothetical protein
MKSGGKVGRIKTYGEKAVVGFFFLSEFQLTLSSLPYWD